MAVWGIPDIDPFPTDPHGLNQNGHWSCPLVRVVNSLVDMGSLPQFE